MTISWIVVLGAGILGLVLLTVTALLLFVLLAGKRSH